ncbi:MAG: spore coat protein YlbD [bacterium]
MGASLEEFKNFVKIHPGLSNLVTKKEKSWQDIYEDWTFYKDDNKWDEYKDPKTINISNSIALPEEKEKVEIKEEVKSSANMEDMMKSALNYVKKINPDTITKTVSNAQKVLALITGLGIGGAAGAAKSSNTGDPLFDKKFDEWY